MKMASGSNIFKNGLLQGMRRALVWSNDRLLLNVSDVKV